MKALSCKKKKGMKKQRTEEEMGRVLSVFDRSGQSVRSPSPATTQNEKPYLV